MLKRVGSEGLLYTARNNFSCYAGHSESETRHFQNTVVDEFDDKVGGKVEDKRDRNWRNLT